MGRHSRGFSPGSPCTNTESKETCQQHMAISSLGIILPKLVFQSHLDHRDAAPLQVAQEETATGPLRRCTHRRDVAALHVVQRLDRDSRSVKLHLRDVVGVSLGTVRVAGSAPAHNSSFTGPLRGLRPWPRRMHGLPCGEEWFTNGHEPCRAPIGGPGRDQALGVLTTAPHGFAMKGRSVCRMCETACRSHRWRPRSRGNGLSRATRPSQKPPSGAREMPSGKPAPKRREVWLGVQARAGQGREGAQRHQRRCAPWRVGGWRGP